MGVQIKRRVLYENTRLYKTGSRPGIEADGQ